MQEDGSFNNEIKQKKNKQKKTPRRGKTERCVHPTYTMSDNGSAQDYRHQEVK